MAKEFQPPRRKNRPLLRVGAAVASFGLALPACGTGGSGETSTTTVPGLASTTVPSTTELPTTTTIEPKPNDVVEHRDGYDVLRNGGLLTKVESINVEGVEIDTSWFGGFETHIESQNVTFGMRKDDINGVQSLLVNLLRTFGNQHAEFVKADGQVDIQAYLDYLKANNWVDPEVYVPHDITKTEGVEPSPGSNVVESSSAVQSDSFKLDLTKSFILSNNQISLIDGLDSSTANFFSPTNDTLAAIGITKEGQFFFSLCERLQSGTLKELTMEHPNGTFPIAESLGFFLQLTSRITYPVAKPEDLWSDTVKYFYDPVLVQPSGDTPPYPVIFVYDFVRFESPYMLNRIFAPSDTL